MQGPCGNGPVCSRGLAAVRLAADQASGRRRRHRWSARSQRRGRTTLTPPRTGAGCGGQQQQQPASGHGPPPRRLGEGSGEVVRAGAPSLIWVLAPWRGDKMIDGVTPGVRGRSVFLGRPRQRVAAGALREPAAAHLLRCGHRTHAGHLKQPQAAAGAAGRRRPGPAPARPARPGRGGRGGPACGRSTGSRGWRKGGL